MQLKALWLQRDNGIKEILDGGICTNKIRWAEKYHQFLSVHSRFKKKILLAPYQLWLFVLIICWKIINNNLLLNSNVYLKYRPYSVVAEAIFLLAGLGSLVWDSCIMWWSESQVHFLMSRSLEIKCGRTHDCLSNLWHHPSPKEHCSSLLISIGFIFLCLWPCEVQHRPSCSSFISFSSLFTILHSCVLDVEYWIGRLCS